MALSMLSKLDPRLKPTLTTKPRVCSSYASPFVGRVGDAPTVLRERSNLSHHSKPNLMTARNSLTSADPCSR